MFFKSDARRCACHSNIFHLGKLFPKMSLWSGGKSVCPDAQTVWLRGLLSHRQGWGGGQTLICRPPIFHIRCACGGRKPTVTGNVTQPLKTPTRLAKPQADNEWHTVMTTCTFMERGGRTSLAQTLAVRHDETTSIKQTITQRALMCMGVMSRSKKGMFPSVWLKPHESLSSCSHRLTIYWTNAFYEWNMSVFQWFNQIGVDLDQVLKYKWPQKSDLPMSQSSV